MYALTHSIDVFLFFALLRFCIKPSSAMLYERKQSGDNDAPSTNLRSAFPIIISIFIRNKTKKFQKNDRHENVYQKSSNVNALEQQQHFPPRDCLTRVSFYFHILLQSVLFGVSLRHMLTKWEHGFISRRQFCSDFELVEIVIEIFIILNSHCYQTDLNPFEEVQVLWPVEMK